MTPSPWLYGALKSRIPFRPTAWREHRKDPWTIGYGFTGHLVPGTEVMAGATIDVEAAEWVLRNDIETAAIAIYRAHDHAQEMTQGQFDVLVALRVVGR